MLRLLDMQAAPIAKPLLTAVALLRSGIKADPPMDFLRPNSKWHRHLRAEPAATTGFGKSRCCSTYATPSGRATYGCRDRAAMATSSRSGPATGDRADRAACRAATARWLAERRAQLDTRLKELGRAARTGTIPGGIIENGKLHIDKLKADTPEGAEDLVLDLYQQLPPARITDLLLEVDERTGFSEAFTHLRTGAPCSDRSA
jgi:hypothetical protein